MISDNMKIRWCFFPVICRSETGFGALLWKVCWLMLSPTPMSESSMCCPDIVFSMSVPLIFLLFQ